MRDENATITMRPPARYKITLSGASRSAVRPIDVTPPMMTSQVSTAMAIPDPHVGMANWLSSTIAIELGCVNGVVVSAATAATSAYVQARAGDFRPSRR